MKKILVAFCLLIYALSMASAIDTQIKIKTSSFTEVNLAVINPDANNDFYGVYKKTSDYYGDVTFVYSGEESIFNLMITLKKADEIIYSEKIEESYIAGNPIYLEVIPSGYELIETPTSTTSSSSEPGNESSSPSNSTEETNETVSEIQEESKKSKLSGFFISKDSKLFSSKTIWYILGGIVLAGAIIFFVLKQIKTPKKIKVTKLSEIETKKENKEIDSDGINSTLEEAEERIRKAQMELDSLKKKQRIKELKAELKRLNG